KSTEAYSLERTAWICGSDRFGEPMRAKNETPGSPIRGFALLDLSRNFGSGDRMRTPDLQVMSLKASCCACHSTGREPHQSVQLHPAGPDHPYCPHGLAEPARSGERTQFGVTRDCADHGRATSVRGGVVDLGLSRGGYTPDPPRL